MILLVLLLLVPGGEDSIARAQAESGVNLTAGSGLDGYCRTGAWIPIRILLENSGTDIDGRIEVAYTGSGGHEVVFGQDILLPTNARKDLFLYIHPDGSSTLAAVRLTANGKILAKAGLRISCLDPVFELIGILSDDPSAFDHLSAVNPLRGSVRLANLRLDELPDRIEGWYALDALVIADTDTGPLTEAQRSSLKAWVSNGGRLLVVGGPRWQGTTAGLDDLMPLDLAGTLTTSSLSSLQAYLQADAAPEGEAILAVGTPRPGSQVMVEQDGSPVLVEMTFGFGEVFYLSADPALQPLSDWDGIPDLYDQLLHTRNVRPGWFDDRWNPSSASEAVSTVSVRGIPAYGTICIWLAIYVLVVGPINLLVIRRTKRRELAWLTIPILVILFSGMDYTYGVAHRGPRPILNRLALIQSWPGSDTALVRGAVGLYSPRRAKYTLSAADPFLFLPFQEGVGVMQDNQDWLSVHEGGRVVLTDVPVEVGGLSAVSVQGSMPAVQIDHTLTLAIGEQNPVLAGQITNSSGYELHDVMLVAPGGWRSLSDLQPGQSVQVRMPLQSAGNASFYDLSSDAILGLSYRDYQEDIDAVRRVAWLDAVTSDYGGYTGYSSYSIYGSYPQGRQPHWGIFLIGWLDQPVLPVEVDDKLFDTIDTTMVSVMLLPTLQTGSGPLRITHSLFAWESSVDGASPYQTNEIPQEGVTLRFRQAYPIRFSSVISLSMDLTSDFSGSSLPPEVSLWDFQAGKWVGIKNARWGQFEIPEPGLYVSANGEIWLKLEDPGNNNYWNSIDSSTFTLVVDP
jgi:hypothetical protein